MLEVVFRIYEVADEETAARNFALNNGFGLFNSTSKSCNTELLMDCIICDSRDHFKEIIRDMYGQNIRFSYSKKLKPGDLYCVIIGEHCYNTERYFNKVTFTCDCCGATVETYYGKPIYYSDWEIRQHFFNIQEYAQKRFCSGKCKQVYEARVRESLKPDNEQEFYIQKDMFTENVAGYIYKITKKSTGEFYVGQTVYAQIFRWGQHLKTDRFPIKNITDYKFEVLEIVPKGENILEREKYYIQKYYMEDPERSLNIMCTKIDVGSIPEFDFSLGGE